MADLAGFLKSRSVVIEKDKECVRCGNTKQLRIVAFKIYGITAVWENSNIYCKSCIKDLGWEVDG
jgi:late competence protein required for DNA uptake (superfamily II DNA/RNA helicase)